MSKRTILLAQYSNVDDDITVAGVAAAPTKKQALELITQVIKDDWKKRGEDGRNDPTYKLTDLITHSGKAAKQSIGRFDILEPLGDMDQVVEFEGYHIYEVPTLVII